MDRRGGAGAKGGDGGRLLIEIDTARPNGQQILLFGYNAFEATGGNGATGGGGGGAIILSNNPSGGQPGGGVVNYANASTKGGNATVSGAGGPGAGFLFQAGGLSEATTSSAAIVSAGTIDASGGDGIAGGGYAGDVTFGARERIGVFGAVKNVGGSASGASGTGGQVYAFDATAGTAIDVIAAITLEGGNGTGATSTGGSCQMLRLRSGVVHASGALTCRGGNGNGAQGGNGGPITVTSSLAPSVVANATAPGGTGTPAGTAGAVTIDGVVQ